MRLQSTSLFAAALLAVKDVSALNVDLASTDSISSACGTIAKSIMDLYHESSGYIGVFGQPYYFWEAGLAWDTMINYWFLTGDDQYNDIVSEALVFQMGPDSNYMPPNQTASLGNDDQSSWALAAMTAAERGFPAAANSNISWVELAQNVFDTQVARWDTDSCGGGLRWQIFVFNNGYDYKNSLSNGNFVQLASRLARFTGNQTYSDWAEKATQWAFDVGMISNGTRSAGAVFDGASTTTNCSQFNHIEWTSSIGTFLSGAAYGANSSSTLFWFGFEFSFFEHANYTFFKNNTMYEVACEPNNNCNTDQLAFKAILARALANDRALVMDTDIYHTNCAASNFTCQLNPPNRTELGTEHQNINQLLQASARGAAAQCSGGESGTVCGSNWLSNTWDGSSGLGQDLSALEIMLANLVPSQAWLDINSTSNGSGADTGAGGTASGNTVPSNITGGATPSASYAPAQQSTNGAGAASVSMLALVLGLAFAVVL